MMDERNTLVVPIRLEALAVNSRFKGKPVRRWRMDYDRLLQQKNPEPLPFSTEIETDYFDEPQHWGAYLHWVVPEALRKSGQDDSDQADFPPLPNRWLVARRHGKSDSGTDHSFRFWVIESDKIDPGNKGGSTFACVYPDGNIQVTRLEKSARLEEYAGDIVRDESATFRDIKPESAQAAPGGPQPVLPRSLNALGFGDVNFLAYQPLVNDLFSFHDDLSDIREGEALKREGLLSYCVAGWYSEGGGDILDRAKAVGIEKLLADLSWTVKDPASDARKGLLGPDIPASLKRTVFYGRRYRLDWQQTVPAAAEIKAKDLQVVFGNNALDAMLALLEKTEYGGPVEWGTLQLLKAFVYGQLPLVGEPGGFVGLNQEMRKTWFKAKAGGRCWVLEPRDPADHTEPEAKDEARELIGQINNRQEALEQTRMKLEGLQKLLYDTWWALNAKMKSPGPEPADLNTIEHQIEALKTGALAQQIKQKQIDAGTIEQDIEKKFKAMVSAEVTDKPPDPGVKPKPASGPTDRPLKQFAEFVDQIARRLLLSQSLLDFNSQLQMRGTQLSILPEDEELAELIGEQYQNQPLASPPDPIEGQGMRQGHFKINRLEVYDGFDQCLVLVGPGGPIDAEMFAPVRDNNLTPGAKAADSSQLIELKPRITEYTRLRFDFLPAREPRPKDDSSRTPIYDDNPVAGWFLYNHLDRSLVLFDCPTV